MLIPPYQMCLCPSGRIFGATQPQTHQGIIPYPTAETTGLKISGTPHETTEVHPIQASVPHLQETELPPDHIHSKTNRGCPFLAYDHASTPKTPRGGIREHKSCETGASGST